MGGAGFACSISYRGVVEERRLGGDIVSMADGVYLIAGQMGYVSVTSVAADLCEQSVDVVDRELRTLEAIEMKSVCVLVSCSEQTH